MKLNTPEWKSVIAAVKAKGLIAGDLPQPKAPAVIPKKKETWQELINEELDKDSDISGVSFRRKVIRQVRRLAEAGVPWAVEFFANREEGKPKQQIDLDAKGGGIVQVTLLKFGDNPPPTSESGPEPEQIP